MYVVDWTSLITSNNIYINVLRDVKSSDELTPKQNTST